MIKMTKILIELIPKLQSLDCPPVLHCGLLSGELASMAQKKLFSIPLKLNGNLHT